MHQRVAVDESRSPRRPAARLRRPSPTCGRSRPRGRAAAACRRPEPHSASRLRCRVGRAISPARALSERSAASVVSTSGRTRGEPRRERLARRSGGELAGSAGSWLVLTDARDLAQPGCGVKRGGRAGGGSDGETRSLRRSGSGVVRLAFALVFGLRCGVSSPRVRLPGRDPPVSTLMLGRWVTSKSGRARGRSARGGLAGASPRGPRLRRRAVLPP